VNASLNAMISLTCNSHFDGNQCQKVHCPKKLMPQNSGWEECIGSKQFEDVLETFYKEYRRRQSNAAVPFHTDAESPATKSNQSLQKPSDDLFANRTFVMLVVTILTLIALVESTIIFIYILRSFKRKLVLLPTLTISPQVSGQK
ncbi:hypothetical protein Ciccas_012577, partial [Cichlidogyrus casuarinus]